MKALHAIIPLLLLLPACNSSPTDEPIVEETESALEERATCIPGRAPSDAPLQSLTFEGFRIDGPTREPRFTSLELTFTGRGVENCLAFESCYARATVTAEGADIHEAYFRADTDNKRFITLIGRSGSTSNAIVAEVALDDDGYAFQGTRFAGKSRTLGEVVLFAPSKMCRRAPRAPVTTCGMTIDTSKISFVPTRDFASMIVEPGAISPSTDASLSVVRTNGGTGARATAALRPDGRTQVIFPDFVNTAWSGRGVFEIELTSPSGTVAGTFDTNASFIARRIARDVRFAFDERSTCN